MPPRATAMSADERRKAILDVVVPLLAEKGSELSTREIAEAAGIAEGTIFRVFDDKRALMIAAAKEVINPAGGEELFHRTVLDLPDLRSKVVAAAERVQERMRLTMAVMVAVRVHLMAEAHADEHHRKHPGPPGFVLEAQEALNQRLTALFEPHRDELAIEPAQAAVALRSLVFGASRPELGMKAVLTPDQIADVLLHGVLKRED
ncbi:MAG TPA: helix-turn-helix domain-containing protein [Marmoricola sp.]|nr:helix-turn-helix domain-containing protein [Marmoricola sp.]